MLSLWRRLPVIVRAVLAGAVMAVAGTLPWALLVGANIKYLPSIPWSVPPTVVYLWFFWRYARGEGWPSSTAEARRASHRANDVSGEAWGAAILAGGIGLVAILALQNVMGRLVALPQQQTGDISHLPFLTLLAFLVTSAVVAGVVEETSFRGYMQGPIERRHGVLVAILMTGTLFGFAHFSHPETTLALMPFYIAVGAVYGMLAHLTNSIWPSMVLHAGGNIFAGFALFTGGQSEWGASRAPAELIWRTGPDAAFWFSLLVFLIAAGAAVAAYAGLASTRRIRSPAAL
jgi:membrane protease YdiL (CAAX protease family)